LKVKERNIGKKMAKKRTKDWSSKNYTKN